MKGAFAMAFTNQYPAVFVHGVYGWGPEEGIDRKLPYWGASAGNLMDFLMMKGYESYAVSVGPVSSAWDRACEIYACLTGTTVDYGVAHSAKHNHRRFGRTYAKPLFQGFSAEKKIHLIGHSFGGSSVRVFAYLMAFGSEEERKATPDGKLSGLFTGGKADWISSVTTLCAPHNGSQLINLSNEIKLMPIVKRITLDWVSTVGRTAIQSRLVDFHLEQFGANNTPGKQDLRDYLQVRRVLKKTTDSVQIDLMKQGSEELNHWLRIVPSIYYFSYYFNCVSRVGRADNYRATDADFPFLRDMANLVLRYYRRDMLTGRKSYDELAGDGLVQIASAMHPNNEPFKDYDPENIEPGVWQVMPEQRGDHGTAIGLFAPKERTHAFYLQLLSVLCGIEEKAPEAAK